MPDDCNLIRITDELDDRITDDGSERTLDEYNPVSCESISINCDYRIDENTEELSWRLLEGVVSKDFRIPEASSPSNCCPPPGETEGIPTFNECIHLTEDETYQIGSELSGEVIAKVWEQTDCEVVFTTTPPTTPVPTTPAPDLGDFCNYNFADAADCCPTNPPLECLKLERVITGQNTTIIQASDNSYVLQVEADKTNRKYRTLDPTTNYWLGGLFDSEDFIVDDYFANQKINSALPDSMDFRGPIGKVAGIAQCGEFSVLFKTGVTKGNHWQQGTDENNYVYEDLTVAVYDIETLNNENTVFTELLSSELSDNDTFFENTDIPPKTLSGISWGFLSDAPVSLEYYDFDEGRLYGSSFKGKNPWNLSFDVSAKIDHTDASSTQYYQNARIEDVRSYSDMNIGAGQPWMAYKVRDSYQGERFIDKSNAKEELLAPVNVTLSNQKLEGVFAYEHIERIAGIKRNIPSSSHKSNIFSVRIKDSGLNESIEDDTIRAQTQDGLDKVIREVVGRIAPAQTQLWKIAWEGR